MNKWMGAIGCPIGITEAMSLSSHVTEEAVTIIDWKTGRGTTEDLSLQLSWYIMYRVKKWGINE